MTVSSAYFRSRGGLPRSKRPIPGEARRREAALFASVVLAACLQTACLATSPHHESASTGQPRQGGVLRMVMEPPATLDPAWSNSAYEGMVINQVFDGLVTHDPGLQIVPALASTWSVSRDARLFTFHLRQGAKFHDGAPVTSDDVVFSVRRLLEPVHRGRSLAYPYLLALEGASAFARGLSGHLTGISAPDGRTVVFRLEHPYPSFLEVLAMDPLLIVPRHVVERVGAEEFGRHPIGSGPFRLASRDAKHVRLEANPGHFSGRPFIDAAEIQVLETSETDSGASRFDRGEIDVFDLGPEQTEGYSKDPRVRVHRYQDLSLAFLGFLTGRPPLDDPRIRRAIAHAVDRTAATQAAGGPKQPAVGILPPGMPAYSPVEKTLAHDPGRARRLLEEAGHPGGRGVESISLYVAQRNEPMKRIARRVRDDLAAVGIRVEVREVSWSELSRLTDDHAAPAFLISWIADLNDPDAFLRSLFEAGTTANYFDFSDPLTERGIVDGSRQMNPVERARIYRDLERHILGEAPLVPLYFTQKTLAVREGVEAFHVGPLGIGRIDLARVWIARGGGST